MDFEGEPCRMWVYAGCVSEPLVSGCEVGSELM